jgi:hypothetical protein
MTVHNIYSFIYSLRKDLLTILCQPGRDELRSLPLGSLNSSRGKKQDKISKKSKNKNKTLYRVKVIEHDMPWGKRKTWNRRSSEVAS